MLRFKVMRKGYAGSFIFPLDIYINKTLEENKDITDVIAILGEVGKYEVFYKVQEKESDAV